MTTQNPSQPGDLFFEPIVNGYLSNTRFVRRDWLAEEIDHRLNADRSRFVLLTAEPGFGKSAFMAQLTADHPDWPRYFIRRDQRAPLSDVGARSFLLRIGFQLAALYPELFTTDAIRLTVEQRVGAVKVGGSVVGAEVAKILASPFHSIVVQIQQQIAQVEGSVVGLRIAEMVVEPRLLDLADLQYMALIDPARAIQRLHPERQVVIALDALDEVQYHQADDNILAWLANCPDLPSNVRFVLTSRPPEGAVRWFMDKQQHVLQVLAIAVHDREAATPLSGQVDKDLAAYVDKLASDAAIKTYLDGLPGGGAGFKQQAVVKADGNIGYLDALARAIDQALLKQDSQILAALLAVKTLPDDLQDLYAFFLHQIKQSLARQRIEMVDPETDKTYDKPVWPAVHSRMLAVLAVAREPVTLEQIQYLGSITAGWADLNAAKDSLLQFLDIVDRRYRLYHATLPEFLIDTHTKENTDTEDLYVDARQWHKRIGDRYWRSHSQDWSPCDTYGLAHLPAHLDAAGAQERLHTLRFDYGWQQTKLDRLGIHALLSDFALGRSAADDATRRLSRALEQGTYVLAQDPAQLAAQLLGRLLDDEDGSMQALLTQAHTQCRRPCLLPQSASLREAGALVRTLAGHTAPVQAVAVTSDGSRAVSASDDTTLKVWDLASGHEVYTLTGHTKSILGVAVTPDDSRAISASADNTLKVWDLANGHEVHTLTGHTDVVTGVAVTPDGSRAVSASYDRTLKVWDLTSYRDLHTLAHTDLILGVAVTPDGGGAVSALYDRTLKVWDLASGVELRTLSSHTNSVLGVAVMLDGKRAVSASRDKTLKVWDLASGEELRTLTGHAYWVTSVAVTPDGSRAVSASYDRTLKVWDLASGSKLRTLTGHTSAVEGVTVTPDGCRAVTWDSALKVWDLASGMELHTLTGHAGMVKGVAVTPDRERAVSASRDNTLKVWDLASGVELHTLTGHAGEVQAVAVTPDGSRAVSASWDKTLKVWDLPSGVELHTLTGHTSMVEGVAVTPDGSRAVSASFDMTLKVWDLANGVELHTLTGHTNAVTGVAVTPDGSRAVSASQDKTLRVWNLASGAELRTLAGHTESVNGVVVTPDGSRAISASQDKTLKVWDLASGVELSTLTGHTEAVRAVTMTTNGSCAISASWDNTLKVWDLASWACLITFHADGMLFACAVTPDEHTVVAAGASGRVHFLRLEG